MNRYFTYFIILGSIIALAYCGMEDALSIMYASPLEQQNFGSFFLMMSLIVIVIGMFFQWIVPLKISMINIDIYGPAFVMLVAIIVGNVYSHKIKTDEFLYYFILTHLITMYASLSAGRQLITFFKIGAINIQESALCIIGILLGAAIIYTLNFLFIEYSFFNGIWHIYFALLLSTLVIDWSGHLFKPDQLSKPT